MPLNAVSNVHGSLLAKASKSTAVQDSLPRPSRIHVEVRVTGVGETRLTGQKAVDFGAFMTEKPSFACGVVAESSVGYGELPIATATVLRYVQNENGLYTGAEIGFKVESVNSRIALIFSLTFEAVTLRATIGHDASLGAPSDSPNYFRG